MRGYDVLARAFKVNASQRSTALPNLPPNTPPDLVDFYAYWLSLPKKDLLPNLSDYLDHAPMKLQARVGIVDVISPTESRIRFYGTGLSKVTGVDPTGATVTTLYSADLKGLSDSILWQAVVMPVGYICIRDTRTKDGATVHSPSICLPMKNGEQPARLVVNYSNMSAIEAVTDFDDQPRLVIGWKLVHWIDIGAGTPN